MAQLGGCGPGSLLRLLPGCQVGLEEPASKFTPKASRQASRATGGHFSSLSQSCSGQGSWLPAGKKIWEREGGKERETGVQKLWSGAVWKGATQGCES